MKVFASFSKKKRLFFFEKENQKLPSVFSPGEPHA
jgi:hypothetical protein